MKGLLLMQKFESRRQTVITELLLDCPEIRCANISLTQRRKTTPIDACFDIRLVLVGKAPVYMPKTNTEGNRRYKNVRNFQVLGKVHTSRFKIPHSTLRESGPHVVRRSDASSFERHTYVLFSCSTQEMKMDLFVFDSGDGDVPSSHA